MDKQNFTKKSLMVLISIVSISLSLQSSADTLQNVLRQTLQTNPTILASMKDRYAIGEELKQAKDAYLPTLDANASVGVQRVDSPFTYPVGQTQTLHPRQLDLTADQLLFDGFGTPREVDRNQARVCAASYKILGTSQDILLEATKAYLDVLKEQQFVQEAQANVKLHHGILGLIRKRNQSGIDQTADVTQTSGRAELAEANLQAEQANLMDSESNYLQIVGQLPQHLTLPASPSPAYIPATENQAIQIALANHPTLKSAMQDMRAAYAQHKAAQSKNYPRVDLQLNANRDRDVGEIAGINNYQEALLRMNYNLYHGGADKARQDQTAFLYQESAEVMHKTYRQVVNNVKLSWSNWKTAQTRLALLREHRNASLKTFNAYKQQFQLDKRTLLDSLNAQDEYYQATRAYTQGEFDVLYGEYRVLNSMGALMLAEHLKFSASAL